MRMCEFELNNLNKSKLITMLKTSEVLKPFKLSCLRVEPLYCHRTHVKKFMGTLVTAAFWAYLVNQLDTMNDTGCVIAMQ